MPNVMVTSKVTETMNMSNVMVTSKVKETMCLSSGKVDDD